MNRAFQQLGYGVRRKVFGEVVPGAATRPSCCAKKSRARRPGGANQGGLTSGRREDLRSSNLQASRLKHGPTEEPILMRRGSTKGGGIRAASLPRSWQKSGARYVTPVTMMNAGFQGYSGHVPRACFVTTAVTRYVHPMRQW